MHSSDDTLRIIKSYTDKVYTYKKKLYVEPARNFAISKAEGDWILIIDADETIPSNAEIIIKNIINNKIIDGYWFPRRQYIKKNIWLHHGYFYPDWQLRLFRNYKGYKFSGKIHEPIRIPRKKTKYIHDLIIHHNFTHSKYNSIFSIVRMFRYIRVEGTNYAAIKISLFKLFLNGIIVSLRHFWRSFIKLQGYKDGFYGLQAAYIYGIYKGLVLWYALYIKLKYHFKMHRIIY